MRFFIAGFLCLWLPSVAFAQARGEVEALGFAGAYRPGCWTPLVVRLTPTTGSNFTGRIEVVQEDLDRDRVIFTRQINLTGTPPNGSPVQQRFWMYFMPQPSKEATLDRRSKEELSNKYLRVRLVSDAGKELEKLPVTVIAQAVESERGGGMGAAGTRGMKLVLCVTDQSVPALGEYQHVLGLNEDVSMVAVRNVATEVPDSAIGYDAVDAIVWADADPLKLSAEQLGALEEYVRRGGRLVILQDTQTNQWQRNNVKFPLLMPVTVRGVEERSDGLATLRALAGRRGDSFAVAQWDKTFKFEWDRLVGPFRYAAAEVKPNAVVSAWQVDSEGKPLLDEAGRPKPHIVRQGVGLGSVTWVAQDLGERQVLGQRFVVRGWPEIWDRVLDLPNEPVNAKDVEAAIAPYKANITWEFGRGLLKYMDLPSTSAALIGIAVLFFIAYWVAAGPGSFFVLSRKGKAGMSWFTFAAMAIGATGLTYVIVKLVLSGDPQMQHVTVVRAAAGEPALARTNFGLYIPSDGYKAIELKDAAPNATNYVTAFNLHPGFNQADTEFPAWQEYRVPVKSLAAGADTEAQDPRLIRVPYRSTLKKFTAVWQGNLSGGINGTVRLTTDDPIARGVLTNDTGRDLRMVYLAFHHPAIDRGGAFEAQDVVLYVSRWPKGGTIDLAQEFKAASQGGAQQVRDNSTLFEGGAQPKVVRLRGFILPDTGVAATNWTDFWYRPFRSDGAFDKEHIEEDPLTPKSFALLSFFDRIPVSRNHPKEKPDRIDVLRRGVRHLDLSPAISGGNLAVIAVAEGAEEAVPVPIEVDGERMDKPGMSKGVVYYQFVLPLDRSGVSKPPASTQPTTQKGKAVG